VNERCDLVITNGAVHLPGDEVINGWLAVVEERVAAIGEGTPPLADVVIDARGGHVLPGAVDTHVHFRDPGDTEKEDFSTGSLAAAFGGVTTVVDMPNTGHVVVTPDDFREKRDYLAGRSWVDFGLHANFNDSSGFVDELADLGVASLKWLMGYGDWKGFQYQPSSYAEARATFIAAARAGVGVMVHAESLPWLTDFREWLRSEGRTDAGVHNDSRPPFVEAIAVAEAAIVAAEFGCRLHIVHLTGDVPLRTAVALRDALGADLTIETCPQYLFLTEQDVAEQGVSAQVNPPVRSAADLGALWEGIAQGAIYSVASDHAPHLAEEKTEGNPLDSLSGFVGVETMLPLLLDAALVGRTTIGRVVELLCEHPARLVRLWGRKGALLPGFDADVVVIDPEGRTRVRGEALHSKQRTTPFEGCELHGAITHVLLRGRPLIADGARVAEEPFGEHAPSRHAAADSITTVDALTP
jgi:dihydroorotase (multifunctional complex type)